VTIPMVRPHDSRKPSPSPPWDRCVGDDSCKESHVEEREREDLDGVEVEIDWEIGSQESRATEIVVRERRSEGRDLNTSRVVAKTEDRLIANEDCSTDC
jgi:hypothetical protein